MNFDRMIYKITAKQSKVGFYGFLTILFLSILMFLIAKMGFIPNYFNMIGTLLILVPGSFSVLLWLDSCQDRYLTIKLVNFDYFKIRNFIKRVNFIKDTFEFTKDEKYRELLEEAQKSLYVKLSSIYNKVYVVTDKKIDKSAIPLIKSIAIEKFGMDNIEIISRKKFKKIYNKFKNLKDKNFPENPFKLKILSETIYSDNYVENGYDI